MFKKISVAVALVSTCGFVGLLASQSSIASQAKVSGFFVDGNLGYGDAHGLEDNHTGSGPDGKGFVWNANVGYKFSENFALEAGYWGYPKVKNTDGGIGSDKGNGDASYSQNFLVAIPFKAILPLDSFHLWAKTGPAWGHTKINIDSNAVTGGGNDHVTIGGKQYQGGKYNRFTWFFGLGAAYHVTESVFVGVGAMYSLKHNPVPAMYSVTGNIGYIF